MNRIAKEKFAKVIMILLGTIVVVIIAYFIHLFNKNNRDLEENGQYATGVINDIYQIKSKGDFISYTFDFGGTEIEDNQHIVRKGVKVGDCYKVLFSTVNPQNCKMLLDEPQTCP